MYRGSWARARARIAVDYPYPLASTPLLPLLALCTQGSRDLIARTLADKPCRRTLINRHLIDRTHARLQDVELHRFYATAIKKCISKRASTD